MKQSSSMGIWNPGWQADIDPILQQPGAFAGEWKDRNWRNLPGPFYGAETDTCGTGPVVAPKNVFLDPEGHEFITIQPRNLDELASVTAAATHDPFAGYGADGNERWTAELVREWWEQRSRLVEELTEALERHAATDQHDDSFCRAVASFVAFLQGEAQMYTQRYLFWIDNRRRPGAGDLLPRLARQGIGA